MTLNKTIPRFDETLRRSRTIIDRKPTSTLQINLGKRCNQACKHCHVEAGPKRTEMMTQATASRILALLADAPQIHTVDITGGAPELNPQFRMLVQEARKLGKTVIDRCNLTVFFEPGQEDTPEFLREHQVQVIASLPCYTQGNVDQQRGGGAFEKSIQALLRLNALGYGKKDTDLVLHLVYNPIGAYLPGNQASLEADYRRELRANFGIEFSHLFTITNMPIKRFLSDLEKAGKYEEYMDLLVESYNPAAASNVMCRSLLSIGWDGKIYDCDFNQMLDLPVAGEARTLWDLQSFSKVEQNPITFGDHCYGCTAGSGSSCGGALA